MIFFYHNLKFDYSAGLDMINRMNKISRLANFHGHHVNPVNPVYITLFHAEPIKVGVSHFRIWTGADGEDAHL